MLLILKTETTVFIAVNASHYIPQGTNNNIFYEPENLPFFSVKKTDNTIVVGSGFQREIDVLRYYPLIEGVLDRQQLLSFVLPKITTLFKQNFLIENNGEFRNLYIFAQNENAYLMHYNKTFSNILSFHASEYSNVVKTCLELNKHLPPLERIKIIFETIGIYSNMLIYPIVVTDTVSQKIRYFKGGDQDGC